MGLQYSIDVLAALKEAGYSQYRLMNEKILSHGTLTKLRKHQPVNWEMIEKVCTLLRCQPSDFLIWTPEDCE